MFITFIKNLIKRDYHYSFFKRWIQKFGLEIKLQVDCKPPNNYNLLADILYSNHFIIMCVPILILPGNEEKNGTLHNIKIKMLWASVGLKCNYARGKFMGMK